MITLYTILVVSFFGLAFLTYNKMLELTTGKNIVKISSPARDQKLKHAWNRFVYQITHVSWKSIKRRSYKIMVSIENYFLKVIIKLGKKFSTLGDIVRGKNIPRNRGSVSFFLKNLENGRN